MEEWVGRQWHRFIARAAERQHADAAVQLPQMQRTIGMMFRAGGGAAGVRLAPAADAVAGGPRSWLQRVAGSGTHVATGRLEPDVLSLPPQIAVFADAELNRALYLWLAALAAQVEPTGDWLGDNQRASTAALAQYPGLAERHTRLVQAQLALRPDMAMLKGPAAQAEMLVRRVLQGQPVLADSQVRPTDVAPVWLWLDTRQASTHPVSRDASRPDTHRDANAAPRQPGQQDARRRQAEAVQDERTKAPLLMFFRAESILSWGEFIKVNRASDDDDDGQAINAANDMDTLAIAPDGQTAASRVKFDLDLPSAAADDQPLDPSQAALMLPEWDYRTSRLLPDHCAVTTLVASAPEPYTPSPALRQTARRVRRRMEVLRAGMGRLRAQADGDEIDLDAWVRHRVDAAQAPRSDSPAVYTRRVRSQRSLATLLLADLSLSTDAYATNTARVIDVIREALYVFGEALHASGDPFEMLGFSSVRRQHVRMQHLKGFDEPWAALAQQRVGAIKPGYYTRMGAAIRAATLRLQTRPERQRLLLILTDGKPNDLDLYEGRYGLEDTRHAVQAARAAGLTPFCVTIDEAAHAYLPQLFGQHAYALVHRPQDLVRRLAAVHAQLTRGA